MKVLHIITGLRNGGAERTLFRIVSSEKEHTHFVISLMDLGVYGERLLKLGHAVEVLNMKKAQFSFWAFFTLFKLIKNFQPDVIQTWMYHADLIGGLVGRVVGVKYVFWGIRGPYNKSLTPTTTKIVVKICALLSYIVPFAIVSNSKHAIKAHITEGYSKRRFVHIPNGYDAEVYNSKYSIRDHLNLDEETILFGMVGRYDPYKDHKNLLTAFSELTKSVSNIALVLVGPNMDHSNKELLRIIEGCNINQFVFLLGSRKDVPNVMESLDIHVLSSLSESFPNVLLEAMAAGTPCVSTDVGDAATIVGDTGWVVPPSDPHVLKNGMLVALDAMQNKQNWNKLKNSCRERVCSEFNQEKMINLYRELWSEAARG